MHIQNVTVTQSDTWFTFGDELIVIVDLNHKCAGLAVADPVTGEPVARCDREEGEDRGDFLYRAMHRGIARHVYGITWHTQEPINYAEKLSRESGWISKKRKLLFG